MDSVGIEPTTRGFIKIAILATTIRLNSRPIANDWQAQCAVAAVVEYVNTTLVVWPCHFAGRGKSFRSE
jgi:hypothetical protein